MPDWHENEDQISLFLFLIHQNLSKFNFQCDYFLWDFKKSVFQKWCKFEPNKKLRPIKLIFFFFSLYKISTWLYSKSSLTAFFMINRIRKGCNIWTNFSSLVQNLPPAILLRSPLISLRCFNSISQPEKVINLSRLFDFFFFWYFSSNRIRTFDV